VKQVHRTKKPASVLTQHIFASTDTHYVNMKLALRTTDQCRT